MTRSGPTVVLGASGFVGSALRSSLGGVGLALHPRPDVTALDLTSPAEVLSALSALRPSRVVNCVGLADVDAAERDPATAGRLNGATVENLAEVRRRLGFRLVHISTDYVFDGTRGLYREEDPPAPLNEYGRSKLRGERALAGEDNCLVVRISSPFGPGFGARKPQFFRFVQEALRAGRPVRALTDQRVTATYLPDLAAAVAAAERSELTGLLHVGSREPRTRFEFAREVAAAIGASAELVTPSLRGEMTQWTAPRPADTSLDVERSVRLGVRYTSVAEALRELLTGSEASPPT